MAAVNIEAEQQRQKQSCYQDDRAADKENRVDHTVIIYHCFCWEWKNNAKQYIILLETWDPIWPVGNQVYVCFSHM